MSSIPAKEERYPSGLTSLSIDDLSRIFQKVTTEDQTIIASRFKPHAPSSLTRLSLSWHLLGWDQKKAFSWRE
jgi:hypothetical protein